MDEHVLGQIRRGMQGAGIPVEFSKGEAWYGQHELNCALRRCGDLGRPPHDLQERRQGDRVPERRLGDLHGQAVGEGHRQLMPHPLEPRRAQGPARVRSSTATTETDVFRHYLGGHARPDPRARAVRRPVRQLLQALRDRELGADVDLLGSRQPDLRLPRRRPRPVAARRVPDPRRRRQPRTSATRRCSRPGSTGSRTAPIPGPELKGNAYAAGEAEPFPATLREAVELWEGSEFARATFGEDVWRHYLNYGRTEQRLFDQVVTDYERRRMFERG